mgnify:CR=1 FL=1
MLVLVGLIGRSRELPLALRLPAWAATAAAALVLAMVLPKLYRHQLVLRDERWREPLFAGAEHETLITRDHVRLALTWLPGRADAGILVHAYLMYGFPTQTVQDTVDALEYVRQLFEAGCIQSGFFHRFACTVHSPVGRDPQDYGVTLQPLPPVSFAQNDVGFIDPSGVDHDALGRGLKKAIYNYMHGIGLDQDVRRWFDGCGVKVPRTTVHRQRIARALADMGSTPEPAATVRSTHSRDAGKR